MVSENSLRTPQQFSVPFGDLGVRPVVRKLAPTVAKLHKVSQRLPLASDVLAQESLKSQHSVEPHSFASRKLILHALDVPSSCHHDEFSGCGLVSMMAAKAIDQL